MDTTPSLHIFWTPLTWGHWLTPFLIPVLSWCPKRCVAFVMELFGRCVRDGVLAAPLGIHKKLMDLP